MSTNKPSFLMTQGNSPNTPKLCTLYNQSLNIRGFGYMDVGGMLIYIGSALTIKIESSAVLVKHTIIAFQSSIAWFIMSPNSDITTETVMWTVSSAILTLTGFAGGKAWWRDHIKPKQQTKRIEFLLSSMDNFIVGCGATHDTGVTRWLIQTRRITWLWVCYLLEKAPFLSQLNWNFDLWWPRFLK